MTTPNELDDRLTDLLARAGAAVDVQPGLDAVIADDGHRSPVVDLGRRPRDVRRLLALAAAVALVLGLAGAAAFVTRDDDQPLDVAEVPAEAGQRFPVFSHLPADLDGTHVEANEGEGSWRSGLGSSFDPDLPVVRAALGRPAPDGTIDDIVLLAAVASVEGRSVPGDPMAFEDLGGGYELAFGNGLVRIYGPGTTVEVVSGSGDEDLARQLVAGGLTVTVGPDGGPALTLGALPDGYEVTAPPTASEPEQAEIAVPTGPPCSAPSQSDCGTPEPTVVVETGVGPPALAVMSAGGTVTPVDVGGRPGLMSNHADLTRIAWTAPNGVTLSLFAEYGPGEALAIARGVRLVDEQTWRTTYPEWPEDEAAAPTTGTTVPDSDAPTETTEPDVTTASEPAETTAPDPTTADEAEIDAAFHTAFDADIPEEERFAAVEDGPALVAAGREAVARYPAAADSISVTVHDIEVVAPDRATVVFELLYDDAQPLGRQTGEAVLLDGAWKVTRETRCAIIRQAGVECP